MRTFTVVKVSAITMRIVDTVAVGLSAIEAQARVEAGNRVNRLIRHNDWYANMWANQHDKTVSEALRESCLLYCIKELIQRS